MSAAWTIHTLVTDMALRGDAPAVIAVHGDSLDIWSHAKVADLALRLASGLVAAGAETGEPIGLYAPNGPAWVVVRLALGAAGALMIAIDDLASAAEVGVTVASAGCRRIFTTAEHIAALRALPDGAALEIFALDGGEAEDARPWTGLLADAPGPLPAVDAAAPTVMVHTSGTTGKPKSFTLTHANLWANLGAIWHERQVRPEDRLLLPLPLHHVYPQLVGMLTPLGAGGAVVFPEAVAGPEIIRAATLARATIMVGVPRLYAALVAGLEGKIRAQGRLAGAVLDALLALSLAAWRRFGIRLGKPLFAPVRARIGPALDLLASGGAKLDLATAERLTALGWTVQSGYGLAETASIFTGNLPRAHRLGSEGRPLGEGRLRIAEPRPDGTGEIQLSGANVFTGYRDNPEANQAAFSEDGWFRTGDLGHVDADGYLYVTGRLKEMIVLGGGKNVFPEDLELVYGDTPYIRELAVLEKNGALVALVLPDPTMIRAAGLTNLGDALRVSLAGSAQRLPPYQRLAGFAIARELLPRTRIGKIQRFRLPELYERARAGLGRSEPAPMSDTDRALLAEPRAQALWQLLHGRYAERGLSLDASPQLDLGIDSLEALTLAMELESRLGIRLPESELAAAATVRALIDAALSAATPSGPPALVTLSPDEERWLRPPGPLAVALGRGLYGLDRLLMAGYFSLQVDDALPPEPPAGPFMVVANHVSDLDPLVLAAALPKRWLQRLQWSGDAERVFGNPLLRPLCRALRVFPVDERSPSRTLAMASAVLARGSALIWFPEGWRSPDGSLQRFLPGIGHLLDGKTVPVIPAHIAGAFEAWPRDRSWPRRHPVRVRFGRAITADRLAEIGEGETPALRIAAALRDAVAAVAAKGVGGRDQA
ncbi:MAG: AMP-binding protein [Azospirillum sp.]|nr:AMP-binding protein [Azospirillum sp.]